MLSFVSKAYRYLFSAPTKAEDLLDKLNVTADISIVPVGVGTSLSPYVKTCTDLLKDHNLEVHTHAFGTNVSGKWTDIQEAIRDCHRTLHGQNIARVSTTVKISTRTDRADQSIASRIKSVVA